MTVILTTRDVVLVRDQRPPMRLPDIELRSGETIALVGKSGSGKTTALMAIAGVRAPAQGVVLIEGTNPWTLSAAARDTFRGRRIGLVFQSFHLVQALSVTDNLRLAPMCAGIKSHRERIESLLSLLGISDIARRRVDRISQGQAQRVAIARALMNAPAVIVADEPSSALDDEASSRLIAVLKEAARSEGAALLIATHDRRVRDVADAVVEMKGLEMEGVEMKGAA
jgi:putative ABC transport system ATP-binding protein